MTTRRPPLGAADEALRPRLRRRRRGHDPGRPPPALPGRAPAQAEVIPPEPPQPDPLVEAALDRARAELAAGAERDRLAAELAFQLGRLDVAITAMEAAR